MRFFADGPNLPDELLEQCDNGEVVFFCGAGVSKNEGLPNFEELTKEVLDHFSPAEGAESQVTFHVYYKKQKQPVLDQVFRCLHDEFGIDEVNRVVAEKLTSKKDFISKSHQTLLTLSQSDDGIPQIVTTNFDLLFEESSERPLPVYEAPFFPRLDHDMSVEGLTYLHGKLAPIDAERHDYILSSADFGKAYLSQGWATEFVRSLLETKTVVLVGYQAEDAPIKYLLQGLNQNPTLSRSIYALDVGLVDDVSNSWSNKGVRAITCSSFDYLWDTLDCWSERKKDPRQWREKILVKAESPPSTMTSWERGQVAHIVKTIAGAKAFADHSPLIHPTWICVLDEKCRLGNISKDIFGDKSKYDPINDFGLDDDPTRTGDDKIDLSLGQHVTLLSALKLEVRQSNGLTLIDYSPPITPRLFHLSRWIQKCIFSPVILWWFFRQTSLHPQLIERISYAIEDDDIGEVASKYWRLALEHFSQAQPGSVYLDPMADFCSRTAKEGWTYRTLREFETLLTPTTEIEAPLWGHNRTRPLADNWEDLSLQDFARFKVKTLNVSAEQLAVPDEKLSQILHILESLLIRSESLISEVEELRFDKLTCYSEREVTGRNYSKYTLFELYFSLFKRYPSIDPNGAKNAVLTWPTDLSIFNMLRLFAFNYSGLFSATEVIKKLLSMPDEVLFSYQTKREFIFLLEDRHNEFKREDLEKLVDRLLAYANSIDQKIDQEMARDTLKLVCRYARRLQLGGVGFTEQQRDQLSDLIDQVKLQIPNWSDEWATCSTKLSLSEISGYRTPEDIKPDILLNLPINEVVQRSLELRQRDFDDKVRYRPFAGLAKEYPRRAILALCYELRQRNFDKELWENVRDHILSCSSARYKRLFFHRLIRLQKPFFKQFSGSLSYWMKGNRGMFESFDKDLYWTLFESVVSNLSCGVTQEKLRSDIRISVSQSTEKHLVDTIFDCINELNLDHGDGIPLCFKSLLERLIGSEECGNDYVKYALASQLPWLSYIDPNWSMETLIPWFDLEEYKSFSAWDGYLSCNSPWLREEFANKIYPRVGQLFPAIYAAEIAEHTVKRAAIILVELSSTQKSGFWTLPPEVARNAIREMREDNRNDVISRLSLIGRDNPKEWQNRVIPFVDRCWPKDLSVQSAKLTRNWLSLLSATGDDFPNVLRVVRNNLRPIGGFRTPLSSLKRVRTTELFPTEMLELLSLVVDKGNVPTDARSVLDSIIEIEPRLKAEPRYHKLMKILEST